MNVVYSTDNIYLPYCNISIISLLENNKEMNMNLYILGHNLSKKSIESINKIGTKYNTTIEIIELNEELINKCTLPTNKKLSYISAVACIRLFLTTILPKSINKVLYIDSDTIIKQNIKELWNTDITDYSVAGVSDYYLVAEKIRFEGYINSGVLLINLDYWRKNNVQQKFIDYVNDGGIAEYPDQDIINNVLKNTVFHLPLKYNAQISFYFNDNKHPSYKKELDVAIQDAAIVHFTGACKPWHKDSMHPEKKSFLKYQKISEYKWKDISGEWSIDTENNRKKKFRFRKRKILIKLGLRKSIYKKI